MTLLMYICSAGDLDVGGGPQQPVGQELIDLFKMYITSIPGHTWIHKSKVTRHVHQDLCSSMSHRFPYYKQQTVYLCRVMNASYTETQSMAESCANVDDLDEDNSDAVFGIEVHHGTNPNMLDKRRLMMI